MAKVTPEEIALAVAECLPAECDTANELLPEQQKQLERLSKCFEDVPPEFWSGIKLAWLEGRKFELAISQKYLKEILDTLKK